jgi:hypothetical protein
MTGQASTAPPCWRVDGGGNHVAGASMGSILMILKIWQQGKVRKLNIYATTTNYITVTTDIQ